MKKIMIAILALFVFAGGITAAAEAWDCVQCGYSASGNFCSNCGIGAEESLKMANNESIVLIGQNVVIDDVCEFVIEDAFFTQRLDPENPAAFYTYYEADEGKKYLCIKVSYMNLEAETVYMQEFGLGDDIVEGELIYADKYRYTGFLCYEEDLMGMGGTLTSAILGSIDPLCKSTMYYLIEVPEIVFASDESVVVMLDIGKKEFELIVR